MEGRQSEAYKRSIAAIKRLAKSEHITRAPQMVQLAQNAITQHNNRLLNDEGAADAARDLAKWVKQARESERARLIDDELNRARQQKSEKFAQVKTQIRELSEQLAQLNNARREEIAQQEAEKMTNILTASRAKQVLGIKLDKKKINTVARAAQFLDTYRDFTYRGVPDRNTQPAEFINFVRDLKEEM